MKVIRQKKQNNTIMKHFLKFTIVWISQNLAIPFWTIGHIHLMTTVYEDFMEIIASFGMNIIVAIGFWINYKEDKQEKIKKL
jgi:hypothetical protein